MSNKTFQPQFWPSVISLVCLLTVVGLGVWQLERLEWKRGILQQLDANLTAEPIPFPDEIADVNALRYQFVELQGSWIHEHTLHLSARYHRGQLGYHLLTPLRLTDGRVVMVNRGWVPKNKLDPAERPETLQYAGESVPGIVRLPNRRNIFTPENDAVQNQWFWYELPLMKKVTGLDLLPLVVEQVSEDEVVATLPVAAPKEIEIRNDHLMYAITWFALAAAIMVIYIVYSYREYP